MLRSLAATMTLVLIFTVCSSKYVSSQENGIREERDVKQVESLGEKIDELDSRTQNFILTMNGSIKTVIDKSKAKEQIYCLARNIYFESRNQPYIGRVAVAYVPLNRSAENHNAKPCDIVYKKSSNGCQFTWVCHNPSKARSYLEKLAWRESLVIAYITYNHLIDDPTDGATYYYNPKEAHPKWAKKMKLVVNEYTTTGFLGDHLFLKSY